MIIKKSYGVICYYYDNEKKEYNFIMVNRKFTYSFSDLILGRWSIDNIEGLYNKFNSMTLTELEILKDHLNYDSLWKFFWRTNVINNSFNYIISKIKYNLLTFGYFINGKFIYMKKIIDDILENKKDKINEYSNYWTFPSGQQETNEKNFHTAIREFIEETGIKLEDINILDTKNKYIYDKYDKDICYKTYYYIISCNKKEIMNYKKIDYNELSGIRWYNEKDEYINNIYNLDKIKNIIKNINYNKKEMNKITNNYRNYSIFYKNSIQPLVSQKRLYGVKADSNKIYKNIICKIDNIKDLTYSIKKYENKLKSEQIKLYKKTDSIIGKMIKDFYNNNGRVNKRFKRF